MVSDAKLVKIIDTSYPVAPNDTKCLIFATNANLAVCSCFVCKLRPVELKLLQIDTLSAFFCFFICQTICLSLFFLNFAKIMCLSVRSPSRVKA